MVSLKDLESLAFEKEFSLPLERMWEEIWDAKVRPNLNTIVIYAIVILIIYWALTAEYSDQHCATIGNKVCGAGKGRAYYTNHPENDDSQETLIKKLNATAKYDQNAVHWRTNMIVAIVSAFIGLFIIQKRFPSARDFGILIIIIFLAGYAASIQFQQGVAVPAGKQADDITRRLLH